MLIIASYAIYGIIWIFNFVGDKVCQEKRGEKVKAGYTI
jgi:hypothetical protein